MDWLKKAVKPMDALIAIVAVWLFADMDYANLQSWDYIYMVCFGIWFVLTGVKIYIYYGRRNDVDAPQVADRKAEMSRQNRRKGHHHK